MRDSFGIRYALLTMWAVELLNIYINISVNYNII